MMGRVLKRPKGGWASTRLERAGDRMSAGVPIVFLFCVGSVLGISVFGATVTAIEAVIAGV